jgi:hypothetical protein
MRRRLSIASIVPALLAGALAFASTAGAASRPPMVVTVQSASGATGNYFDVSATPGKVVRAGTLNVRNQTARRITVRVTPVGALTASTLGSAYQLQGTEAKGPARWADVSRRRVVLGPRASARIGVSARIPGSAEPGDYLAGISVQSADSASQVRRGNVAIASVQRYAVGVAVSVPGPRDPEIKLTDVDLAREPAGVTFSIIGRNTGNVILQDVHGSATVTSGDRDVAHVRIGPGTFVTGTSIAYPILVPSESANEGDAYRVRAVMRYDGGVARIDRVVRFGAVDAKRQQEYGGPAARDEGGSKLVPVLLSLLLLAGVAAAVFYWRRRQVGERAAHRSLARTIAAARANEEPLSVIAVVPENGARSGNLAATVRGRLRRSDSLLRVRDSGLLVVAPDTAPEAGVTLASDIRRHLERSDAGSYRVVPVVDAAQATPEDLLGAVAGAPPGGNGHLGNGTGANRTPSEVNGGGNGTPAARDDGGTHSAP